MIDYRHWFEVSAFLGGEATSVVLPIWLTPLLAGGRLDHVVRQQRSCAYVAVVTLLQAVLYFCLGIYGDILRRGWDQILPWSGTVAGFALFGVVMLHWYNAESVTISRSGLHLRRWFRKPRDIAWRAIACLELKQDRLVLRLKDGASAWFSTSAENLEMLVDAARDYEVRLEGFV